MGQRLSAGSHDYGKQKEKSITRLIAFAVFALGIITTSAQAMPVCTENPIRIDQGRESPNVSANDRAAMFCPYRLGVAIQVEEPT